jgi:hypothetical protein
MEARSSVVGAWTGWSVLGRCPVLSSLYSCICYFLLYHYSTVHIAGCRVYRCETETPRPRHRSPRQVGCIKIHYQIHLYRAGLLLIFRSAHREPLQVEPDRLKCLAVGPGCVGNRTGRGARIFVEEP